MRTGYWSDISVLKFDDRYKLKWVQALPLGNYTHPLYGQVVVTPDRVRRLASSVKNNVREIDLDINYDHREHTGKAAGWIRDAEDRGDNGLWLQIEFTEPAREAIAKGEYRYMSSEFSDEWEHPKTGAKHQDVLFGAALTNRPWLKDILPINMSEVTGGEQVDEFLKQLRDQLGLPEEATQEQILEAAKKEPPKEEPAPEPEPDLVALSEQDRELLKKLGESNPAIKALTDTVEKQTEQITELTDKVAKGEAATKLAEIGGTIQGWRSDKYAVPPSALDGMTVKLAELPPAGVKLFNDFVQSILKTGLVELKERAQPRILTEGKSAAVKFAEEAQSLMSGNKDVSYADAVRQISEDNPGLWEAYRLEQLEGVE